MKPCFVYKHYSAENILLYVGIACNVHRRTNAHSCTALWWPLVDLIIQKRYKSRAEANRAERLAVIREKPLFNIHHRPRVCK